jgi:hypothetical protein
MYMNARAVLGCLTVVTVLAGCGGEAAAPKGSAENPMQATKPSTTQGSAREPGDSSSKQKLDYKTLLKHQSGEAAGTRFTPCSLVTRAQARAILGQPVLLPSEAPQGPTCIYRAAKGKGFVSLAVQPASFAKAKRNLQKATKVDLGTRTGVCGKYGQTMLYAPLPQGRMLTVAAECSVAKRFAAQAVRSLNR